MALPDELSPRAARTRSALIAAGLDLMVSRPIDAIPIDDFVGRAGVAKGSFFNHFRDKQDFANAVAAEVRAQVEARVTLANDGVADPVARIAGGMRVAAEFALAERKRAVVLLRQQASSTAASHPLNSGLRQDIEAACAQGLLRDEARRTGLVYWLGLCQILMVNLVETAPDQAEARSRLRDMLVLGLTGLGVGEGQAVEVARATASGVTVPA